jgi:hypothetical protein
LPADASVLERKKAHIVKMTTNKILNERMFQQMSGPTYIRANISQHHQDSGMSPSEHEAEKVKRLQEN